jgi:hypothetical protein
MARKLNSFSTLLMLAIIGIGASVTMAQEIRKAVAIQDRESVRGVALGCCKCLGGTNSLDVSTIPTNNWTVNGNPAVVVTNPHPAWNLVTGPAKWLSTVATAGQGNVAAGTYEYKLNFVVPACTISQQVTLSGNYGGDDDVLGVFVDNISTSTSTSIASCSGGWCFNTTNNTNPRTFTANISPGFYVLRVKIQNGGGPSGMFVNAKLNGACAREPVK